MTAVLTPEYVAPERTARPAYRPFAATVVNTQALSPHFTRVTFTAQDFDVFGTAGLDQRVKLLFPNTHGDLNTCVATGREEDFLTWYHTWRALPDTERCPMRTYTIRRVNHAAKTVDIDFVTHGATGPGSAWALTARPGDPLILIGPDDRSTDWRTDWTGAPAEHADSSSPETKPQFPPSHRSSNPCPLKQKPTSSWKSPPPTTNSTSPHPPTSPSPGCPATTNPTATGSPNTSPHGQTAIALSSKQTPHPCPKNSQTLTSTVNCCGNPRSTRRQLLLRLARRRIRHRQNHAPHPRQRPRPRPP